MFFGYNLREIIELPIFALEKNTLNTNNMEVKKSPKASLENKKLLFTEIGLVLALLVVWGAFEYSSKEKAVAALEDTTQVLVEEEMVAIQNETPPPPPEAPNIPVLPTRSTSWTMTSNWMMTCS